MIVERVVGYVDRVTVDGRVIRAAWIGPRPLNVIHDGDRIGDVEQVRFDPAGRIIADLRLDVDEPTDAWPVIDLDAEGPIVRAGVTTMRGPIRAVTYTPAPAWPELMYEAP